MYFMDGFVRAPHSTHSQSWGLVGRFVQDILSRHWKCSLLQLLSFLLVQSFPTVVQLWQTRSAESLWHFPFRGTPERQVSAVDWWEGS